MAEQGGSDLKAPKIRRVVAGLVALTAILGGAGIALAGGSPLAITAEPVPLSKDNPDQGTIGNLTYRGGLVLTSLDPRFGGLSGISIDRQTFKTVMVTDKGAWVDMDLLFQGQQLVGVQNARIGRMRGTTGQVIAGKSKADAEALLRVADGFLVSFENDHKIWRYRTNSPEAPFDVSAEDLGLPADFGDVPGNKGLESMTMLNNYLVLMTEQSLDTAGDTRGWLGPVEGAPSRFMGLTLETSKPYSPTDLATLPNGDLLLLERNYSPFTGVQIQLRRIPQNTVGPRMRMTGKVLAQFDLRHPVDNMEGLAVGPTGPRSVLLFMISDDNFNKAQRTILLAFEMVV